jgi:hypothetical protein
MRQRTSVLLGALLTLAAGTAGAEAPPDVTQRATAYTIEPSPGEVGRLNEPVVTQPFDLVSFVDLQASWDQATPRDPTLKLGHAELGISKLLMDRFKFTLTVAYLGGADVAGLGATSIEWLIMPAEAGQETAQMSFVVGRLDVPFGLDWRFNNSFTRRSATAPLVVDATGANWNSHGVDLYGRLLGGRFYYCAWLMQGRQLKAHTPVKLDLDVAKGGGLAGGGRVSFRWPGLPEIGINGSAEYPDSLVLHRVSLDVDLRWTMQLPSGVQLGVLGEVIYSATQRNDGTRSASPYSISGLAPAWGGYLQVGLEHERLFGMLRYSTLREELLDPRQQLTAVLGWAIIKQHMEVRAEYGLGDSLNANRLWLQVVGQI